MTKQSIRSFGFGLLAATATFFLFDYMSKDQLLSNEEMIQLLEEDNYTVLTNNELNEQLVKKASVETISPANAEKERIRADESAISESKEITVTIKAGMSSDDIIDALKKAGVIDDKGSFNTYLKENEYSSKLQIGTFTFSADMPNEEIASMLIK
ncbi:endolytic transglycosylase MltG [Domibacillus mangrovi]|nr:endolytic transglycosylase MltG [Domibacillus mangrovi]